MPKINVTDEGGSITFANAKLIDFVNTGEAVVYYGFESTITAADGDDQGVPVQPGENKMLSGKEVASRVIHFITAEGEATTINYTKGA